MKSTKQDVTVQQLGGVAAWGASRTEGGTSAVLNYTSNYALGTSVTMAGIGIGSLYVSGTNPVGWGYWAVTAAIGL